METPFLLVISVFGFCRDTSLVQGVLVKALRALKRRTKTFSLECKKRVVEMWRSYVIPSGMCFTALESLVKDVDMIGLKEDMRNVLKGTDFKFRIYMRPLSEEELERVKKAAERVCGRS